jgi:hypothetical protein
MSHMKNMVFPTSGPVVEIEDIVVAGINLVLMVLSEEEAIV